MNVVFPHRCSRLPDDVRRIFVWISSADPSVVGFVKCVVDRSVSVGVIGFGEVLATLDGLLDHVDNVVVVLDAVTPHEYTRLHGGGSWRLVYSYVKNVADLGVLASIHAMPYSFGYGVGVAFVDVARRLRSTLLHVSLPDPALGDWNSVVSFIEGVVDAGARIISASDPVLARVLGIEPVPYPLYTVTFGGNKVAPTPRLLGKREWTSNNMDSVVKRFRELYETVWPRADPERVALYGNDPYAEHALNKIPVRRATRFNELTYHIPVATFKTR